MNWRLAFEPLHIVKDTGAQSKECAIESKVTDQFVNESYSRDDLCVPFHLPNSECGLTRDSNEKHCDRHN